MLAAKCRKNRGNVRSGHGGARTSDVETGGTVGPSNVGSGSEDVEARAVVGKGGASILLVRGTDGDGERCGCGRERASVFVAVARSDGERDALTDECVGGVVGGL